jgi:hypothetical protein
MLFFSYFERSLSRTQVINKRYDIEIVVNADQETLAKAKLGTVQNGRMVCPQRGESFAISAIRGDKKINGETIYGLRLWENADLVPRPDDVLQERLYCVRWLETYWSTNAKGEKIEKTRRHFCSITKEDLAREQHVLDLLKEHFVDWQGKGYIPSRKIERGGDKTEEPIRTRGWSYWHHLFNPRQLLMHGTFSECFLRLNGVDKIMSAALCLSIGAAIDNQARLCGLNSHASKGPGSTNHVFTNQVLNTQYNYGVRVLKKLKEFYLLEFVTNQEIESMQNRGRQLSNLFEFFIIRRPKAGIPVSKRLFQFAVEYPCPHLQE